jgi:hypothetical protein
MIQSSLGGGGHFSKWCHGTCHVKREQSWIQQCTDWVGTLHDSIKAYSLKRADLTTKPALHQDWIMSQVTHATPAKRHHTTQTTKESNALHRAFGISFLACNHQLHSVPFIVRTWTCQLQRERVMNQTSRAKEQLTRRWSMNSGCCAQSAQSGESWKLCRW